MFFKKFPLKHFFGRYEYCSLLLNRFFFHTQTYTSSTIPLFSSFSRRRERGGAQRRSRNFDFKGPFNEKLCGRKYTLTLKNRCVSSVIHQKRILVFKLHIFSIFFYNFNFFFYIDMLIHIS